MYDYEGANANKITLVKASDVFLKVTQKVVGTVTVPVLTDGEALKLGTLLRSDDGGETWKPRPELYEAGSFANGDTVYFEGHTFTSTADGNTNATDGADWTDNGKWNPNGVLYTDLFETGKAAVVVTGDMKGKHLGDYDSYLKTQLFDNKLLVK